MGLNTDPLLTIKLLREGKLLPEEARKEASDLISEISSGIYSLEDLGLGDTQELEKFSQKSDASEASY